MNSTSRKATATTAAAVRNTGCIESLKPTRNGLASRGSRCWMKDESCSAALVAPPVPPPLLMRFSTGALFGLAVTAGSWSADWNCGVREMVANADAILLPTVLNRMDRNTAVPSVPPICRKKVADEVATPMSRAGTAFCTAMTSVCMQPPSPSPKMNIQMSVRHSGVSASIVFSSTRADAISSVPMTGKILYRPVRAVS